MLEALASHLSSKNRAAAAGSCTALAAAIRSITTDLKIQAERDLHAAEARISGGHYRSVVCLELKAPAVNDDPAVLHGLLSALYPKLQQLSAHDLNTKAIPSIQCFLNSQQLRSLHLSFPCISPLQAEDCDDLNRALKHLKLLTQLSLSIADWPPHAQPFEAIHHLTNLQQLSLGGQARVSKLPPSLTSLILVGGSAWALSDISSCLQLQQLRFEEAELPDELSTGPDLWEVLTPLTALTASEGTLDEYMEMMVIDEGVSSWARVGSEAPESLPVVRRLKCLAIAAEPVGLLVDDELPFIMHQAGSMSMLTGLETLWVSCSAPADARGLPPTLRELRLGLGSGLEQDESLDLSFISSLSKLTLEVCNASSGCPLLLPTSLEELILVTDEDGGISVPAVPATLPKLRSFSS